MFFAFAHVFTKIVNFLLDCHKYGIIKASKDIYYTCVQANHPLGNTAVINDPHTWRRDMLKRAFEKGFFCRKVSSLVQLPFYMAQDICKSNFFVFFSSLMSAAT